MDASPADDPVAVTVVDAIRTGDLPTLRRLLTDHPGLAVVGITGADGLSRTPLHVVTDWPGYYPNGPAVVEALVAAGADPSAPLVGGVHPETPLHWAASSDDVDVAAALIDGGADIEAPGASIAGGGPLDDAVGYGCWHVARLLVAHGARVDALWKAAALGLQARVTELLDGDPQPTHDDLNHAFWQACHGGQRRMAEYLLSLGADINTVPDHTDRTPLDIAGSPDTRRDTLTDWLRGNGAISGGR